MHTFHTLLLILAPTPIKDTQCGFKLFTRPAARLIFPLQKLTTWIFDVEILLLAQNLGVPVKEVSVGWREVEGSKLNVIWDSVGMARDLLVLRGNWALGRWGVSKREKVE